MGEVVVLRDPGGWDCFLLPKQKLLICWQKDLRWRKKLNREFDTKRRELIFQSFNDR